MSLLVRIIVVAFVSQLTVQIAPSQWTQSGMDYIPIRSLAVKGSKIFAGTGAGMTVSTDGGLTWSQASTGMTDTLILAILVLDSTIYAGTSGGVYRSSDDGQNWELINGNLASTYVQALAGTPGPSGVLYAGTGNGLFKSTNDGATWERFTNLPPNNIAAIALPGPNIAIAGHTDWLFQSTDDGLSWHQYYDTDWAYSIETFFASGASLFAGGDSGVLVSTDDGLNWSKRSNGLPHNSTVYTFAESGSHIFNGMIAGVFVSSNNGELWSSANTGLPGTVAISMAVAGQYLLAGTSTRGVWRRFSAESASPTLVFPYENSAHQPISITCSWNSSHGAEMYHLELATDSQFTNLIFSDSAIVDTFQQLGPLSNFVNYYWRVSAVNMIGEGAYSDVRNFRTMIASPVNPAAAAANQMTTLTWTPGSAGATLYRIYRGEGSPVLTLLDSVISDSLTYRDHNVSNGTSYFYSISAVDPDLNESPLSDIVSAVPANQLPVAAPLADVDLPDAGRVLITHLTFSSTGSYDSDGTVDSVYWYIDGVLTGRAQDMEHDYGPGTALVMLVVEDNNHGMDTSIAIVTRTVFRKSTGGTGFVGLSLLGDSVLYAVAAGDAIYRLDIDGNTLYTLQVGGSVLSASSVSVDTTIYIASTDRNLYAFSKLAAPVWPALPLGGALSATPAVDSLLNRIYIGVQNRNFFSVNRSTGLVDWSYFSDAPIVNSAVVTSDRKLVFSTQAGTIYGFDLANLPAPISPAWTLSIGDTITSSPAIDGDGYFYFGTKSGKVIKVSLQQGGAASVVWQAQTGAAVYASPVIDAHGVLYVGSLDGNFYAINAANGNGKWSFITVAGIRSTAAISNSGVIYFATEGGALYAVDSLMSLKWWYRHGTSISAPLLYHAGTLYASGDDAVIVSFFDGEDPFPPSNVKDGIDLSAKRSTLDVPVWGTFQGNNQRTGAQSSQGTLGVPDRGSAIPEKFGLSQNYPNPFNPFTQIGFDVPVAANVSLKIYNIFGQEIQTLVNERKTAGSYTVEFTAASHLSSSVYFYRIQAGAYTATRKLLLVK